MIDPPIVKRGFLVGMDLSQGEEGGLDRWVVADHLDPKLGHSLELALLAEKGLTARPRFELSGPKDLPAALVVVPDASGAGFEERLLDLFDMGLGNVETE